MNPFGFIEKYPRFLEAMLSELTYPCIFTLDSIMLFVWYGLTEQIYLRVDATQRRMHSDDKKHSYWLELDIKYFLVILFCKNIGLLALSLLRKYPRRLRCMLASPSRQKTTQRPMILIRTFNFERLSSIATKVRNRSSLVKIRKFRLTETTQKTAWSLRP
jgi:hypothetical protein